MTLSLRYFESIIYIKIPGGRGREGGTDRADATDLLHFAATLANRKKGKKMLGLPLSHRSQYWRFSPRWYFTRGSIRLSRRPILYPRYFANVRATAESSW